MKGIIQGMAKRAADLCEPEFLITELNHIYKTLKENGYPPGLVHSVVRRTLAKLRRPQNNTPTGPQILLPYYKGLSEKIQRLGRRLNFSVTYKRGPNLRSILRNDKVRLPKNEQSGVIYEVKCSCSATYIGETGFSLTHRFQQHMRQLRRYNKAKQELENNGSISETHRGRPSSVPPHIAMERALAASAIAEHAAHCSGSLQGRVLCKESHLPLRRIKEALFIRHNTNINQDNGVDISAIWGSIIDATKCCLIE
ncbi:hypothetical protein M514_27857 [Trichuris suis]|uniref:Helix-turn-helix domain-containing protein n=1 Tax=Trichuris suis TaxID=68888 RepID=A0A085MRW4_9BILA|nr:hypothetical protein M514_27857 [Trichuris suis]